MSRDRSVFLRVTEDEEMMIRAAALARGIPLNQLVVDAVRAYGDALTLRERVEVLEQKIKDLSASMVAR